MSFEKKQADLRERDLVRECILLRKMGPVQTFRAALDLDNYVLNLTIDGVKKENPGIGEKELIRELKKIYSLR